ncbi:sigma-54 dependent transcriptional regulator [Chlorobium sp. N1]|uniref:sigma-54 interaction domain-containing protein n=1 Tax=Chlorobium sp. N1 TaxID=2491138 RepID=UPI00103ACF06|nr:sigma-54 dependent transcriptional regulator [Chlorobium sp. N1]TCD48539.1 sigma-54-dependent Fis family transcriptional regulator [Chlorobium sp. N1]
MNNPSILIVGGKPGSGRPYGDKGGTAIRSTHVESTDDAIRLLADGETFNLILVAPGPNTQDPVPLTRELRAARLSASTILFPDAEKLHLALEWFKSLPNETLKGFINPSTPFPEETMPPTGQDEPIFDGLIGESPEMGKLKKLIGKIAPTGTTILLQGESGTGKEVLARVIHSNSSRSKEPFIPVDCAAISGNIIESELFGHARGAFTGAERSTLGMIRSADKGTLFLDEIGELPLNMQAKLLRTLQERTVKPVGDTRLYPVDIRIIAATNRNLAEAVKNGEFREDLYYRLNAITIYAPPLRERIADIPLISGHILERLKKEGYQGKQLSGSALAALSSWHWPGNVRELENVIRRAAMLAGEETIGTDSISFETGIKWSPATTAETPVSIASHEKEAIVKALQKTSGNRREAAELLGISEATLYRRLKVYGI